MDARFRGPATLLLATTVVFTMGCATHRYDAYGNHYYERSGHQHATEGAILGGLAGAGVGSAVADWHHQEAGFWIGGALGALTGAVIGDAIDRNEAAQHAPYEPHGPYGYDPAPPPPRRPHDEWDDEDWDDDDDWEHRNDDDWEYRDDRAARRPPPEPLLLSLPDEVLFERDSADLEAGAKRRLRAVAKAMREHPATVAVIRGHASRQEPSAAALSDARARRARDYLLRQGIAPSRVTAVGLGGRFPVASEQTAEGRQRNRRAEIEIHTDREHELARLW